MIELGSLRRQGNGSGKRDTFGRDSIAPGRNQHQARYAARSRQGRGTGRALMGATTAPGRRLPKGGAMVPAAR